MGSPDANRHRPERGTHGFPEHREGAVQNPTDPRHWWGVPVLAQHQDPTGRANCSVAGPQNQATVRERGAFPPRGPLDVREILLQHPLRLFVAVYGPATVPVVPA